jgi:hypothetical protein
MVHLFIALLVGQWTPQKTCETDDYFVLKANGEYVGFQDHGRWSLKDGVITISTNKEQASLQVLQATKSTLVLKENGRRWTAHRCLLRGHRL